MRKNRKLAQNVWYKVETMFNSGEPLFRLPWAKTLLCRVLLETCKRFGFEMRGLKLDGAQLTFYIKPTDGLQLPKIMQFLKQTFSARFNWVTGRAGHIWGERYWSVILEGEPPKRAKGVIWGLVKKAAGRPIPAAGAYTLTWDSLRRYGLTLTTVVSVKKAPKPPPPPG
ncbi:MAG: hypothetical protein LBG27_11950 [Spirochaetaceae bacterium]|jgi:hypothetical protein|nr:hypothetical protein [Spirochaetaceae bacterium]